MIGRYSLSLRRVTFKQILSVLCEWCSVTRWVQGRSSQISIFIPSSFRQELQEDPKKRNQLQLYCHHYGKSNVGSNKVKLLSNIKISTKWTMTQKISFYLSAQITHTRSPTAYKDVSR